MNKELGKLLNTLMSFFVPAAILAATTAGCWVCFDDAFANLLGMPVVGTFNFGQIFMAVMALYALLRTVMVAIAGFYTAS